MLADRLSGWMAPSSLNLPGLMTGDKIVSRTHTMSAKKRLIRVLVTLVFISALAILNSFFRGTLAQTLQVRASDNWPTYLGGPENMHYSRLKQINRKNVKDLKVAWIFDTGDAYPWSEMQCNPLVVSGVLYATTPKVNVIALDAATGKLLWRFDPHQAVSYTHLTLPTIYSV